MARLIDQPTAEPTRKVYATAIGGALATVVLWAMNQFAGIAPDVGLGTALALIFSVACGYFVREEDTPANPET